MSICQVHRPHRPELSEVKKCCQIMGRDEDSLTAAPLLFEALELSVQGHFGAETGLEVIFSQHFAAFGRRSGADPLSTDAVHRHLLPEGRGS